MKLKCYLVDDEPRAINSLKYLLQQYCADSTEIVGEKTTDFNEAIAFLKTNTPDILFLDIHIGNKTGFDLLQQCGALKHTNIVMVTAHDEYALTAFEHSALGYLLKPVDPEALQKCVDRIAQLADRSNAPQLAQFTKMQKERLFISDRNGWTSIPFKEIVYLKADNSYTHIKLESGQTHTASKGLGYFEQQLLVNEQFIRVHKSFIGNHQHVKRILRKDGGTLEMTGGLMVPITTSAKAELMELLKLL